MRCVEAHGDAVVFVPLLFALQTSGERTAHRVAEALSLGGGMKLEVKYFNRKLNKVFSLVLILPKSAHTYTVK